MNRRSTIKKLMMASVGLSALPAWANGWAPNDIPTTGSFPILEGGILASVADTIIPAGDSFGAIAVGVDQFLIRLFADCYEKEVQDNINLQLTSLEQSATDNYGKSFAQCTQLEREIMLMSRAASEDVDQKAFFDLVKSETIRGFRTSRKVLREHYDYVVAPGHYYGCVTINL